MKPDALIELARPLNCLMAGIAVLIGYGLAHGQWVFDLSAFLLALSAALVCGGGQAINDYFDRGVDARHKAHRAIPSGKIDSLTARNFAFSLFGLGIAIGFGVAPVTGMVALLFSALLVAYSAFLGKLKIVGNWVVALGTAFTFVYGALATDVVALVVFFALSAFLVNVARELIKDLEDHGMDHGAKRTFPHVFGTPWTKIAVFWYAAVGILVSVWPIGRGLLGTGSYTPLIALSGGIVLGSVLLTFDERYHAAQKVIKVGMLFALLAFMTPLF